MSISQYPQNLCSAVMLHSMALLWCFFHCKYMSGKFSTSGTVPLCFYHMGTYITIQRTIVLIGKWRDQDPIWWKTLQFVLVSHQYQEIYVSTIIPKHHFLTELLRGQWADIPGKVNGREEITNCFIQSPPLSVSPVEKCTCVSVFRSSIKSQAHE